MTRLEAICSLIPKCDVLADIGCDHGFISRFVLENNLASSVIATDISEKCLAKAQRLLQHHKNIDFVCTDGLNGIKADVAVIAGMGGHTLMGILSGRLDGTIYILQPQDHVREVRLFLAANGYRIASDFVVRENNKYYDILLASKGEQTLDEFEAALGVFYRDGQPLLKEKTKKLYKKYSSYSDNGKNDEVRAFLQQALLLLG